MHSHTDASDHYGLLFCQTSVSAFLPPADNCVRGDIFCFIFGKGSVYNCVTEWISVWVGETDRESEGDGEKCEERSGRDAYVCLNFYLSVEGGEWEGPSIIPNHLYSAAHITSPRLGVGESRLICIGKSNCWKAVRANKIYGCIDVYIWCFCWVCGAEDKCAHAILRVWWQMQSQPPCMKKRPFWQLPHCFCCIS